jgi:hypothetical protein
VNRIVRFIFVAASGLDCLSGSIARPCVVLLAGGQVMDLAGRLRILPGGLLLQTGHGFALDMTGNGAPCRAFASIQFRSYVFLDSWLLSPSRAGLGERRIGRRLSLTIRAGAVGCRGRSFRRCGGS